MARQTSSMSSSSALSSSSPSFAASSVALANEIQSEAGHQLLELASQLAAAFDQHPHLASSSSPSSPSPVPAGIACIDVLSHACLLSPSPTFANSSAVHLLSLISTASTAHQQSLTSSTTLLISYLAAAADPASHGSSYIARTCTPKIMQALQVASTLRCRYGQSCNAFAFAVGVDRRTACGSSGAAADCAKGCAVVLEGEGFKGLWHAC